MPYVLLFTSIMLSRNCDCIVIDRVKRANMENNHTKTALIILVSILCLAGCKKPPEEMTTKEVYEEYYESICIDLGQKVRSKKLRECVAEKIHESHQ